MNEETAKTLNTEITTIDAELPKSAPVQIDHIWVLDKFGILIISAFSYFLAYTHEVAYCRSFGVPLDLIRPDITTVLHFFTLLMGFSISASSLFQFWYNESNKRKLKTPWSHVISLYVPAICIGIFLWMAAGFRVGSGLFFLAAILFIFAADVICARLSSKKPVKIDFLLKMTGVTEILDNSILGPFKKIMPRQAFLLLIFAYLLYTTASEMGKGEALDQIDFLIPSSNPESVFVRSYGDKIITASIDPKSNTITGGISIITAGADPSVRFESKRIGPLNFTKPNSEPRSDVPKPLTTTLPITAPPINHKAGQSVTVLAAEPNEKSLPGPRK